MRTGNLWTVFLAAPELLEGQTINDLMLPWWLRRKESACDEGDLVSIPGLGRSPGGGHGNPLQYSCLENPHGQRSLVRGVGHDSVTKHSTEHQIYQP